jgi:hypothetical protein
MRTNINYFKYFFLSLLFFAIFPAVEMNAKTIFALKIIFGHHETINGKKFCVDFGICETIIIINDQVVSKSSNKMAEGGETIPVVGEINNDVLTFTFQQKLDKKGMSPDGKFIFPITENAEVKGDIAKEFGLKKFTLPKGNYEFDGKTLKIALKDVKPLEKDRKAGTK